VNRTIRLPLRASVPAAILPVSILLLSMLPLSASADWTGSGELGLVFARGNSDTETINAKLGLTYTRDRWSNETELSYLRSENDGSLDASRFLASNITRYDMNERSYLTGSARYDEDKFSSFEYQATAAVGYGYRILTGETHFLSVEAGPGVRFAESRATGDSETDFIGRGALDYLWNLSETAKLENKFLVETGASNTFFENDLALTVAINGALSLKTGVAVRHNTDVDPGRDNTDVLSTVNLVYSFD
jgi:putative salt-induced outer membrane protein